MMKPKKTYKCKHFQGFSLVELLVAMAITAVVMTAVFKIFISQKGSYVLQEQVAEMQQNGRTAKYVLTREIRMAGYDPMAAVPPLGFVSAYGDSINFTMDIIVENGDASESGENITYSVSNSNLDRNEGSGNQVVVENVEAVGFAYAFDADDDGNIDTSANGFIIWAIDYDDTDADKRLNKYLDTNDDGIISVADDAAGADLATPVPLEQIRAVKIWILSRTGNEDREYSDTSTYVLANQRWGPFNDGRRRQMVITMVKCRNMAL